MLNEHLETDPNAAFASFAFSNDAFSHLFAGWIRASLFSFCLWGGLWGAGGNEDRAPVSHPWALLGIMWSESRPEPWSDSKAQADLMVSRKPL